SLTLQMEKRYLFTPGPTPVPPEVLAATAEPIVHHRGSDFRAVYERVLTRLRDVFRTDADVLLFTASGTGAMESAVTNLTSPGDTVGDTSLVVDAISSLGAVPLEQDEWDIDVVLSGSQKALMCPPGLAMASVPQRILARLPEPRAFYFDWRATKKAQDALDAAFT